MNEEILKALKDVGYTDEEIELFKAKESSEMPEKMKEDEEKEYSDDEYNEMEKSIADMTAKLSKRKKKDAPETEGMEKSETVDLVKAEDLLNLKTEYDEIVKGFENSISEMKEETTKQIDSLTKAVTLLAGKMNVFGQMKPTPKSVLSSSNVIEKAIEHETEEGVKVLHEKKDKAAISDLILKSMETMDSDSDLYSQLEASVSNLCANGAINKQTKIHLASQGVKIS